MIRYFTSRRLSDRLDINLARWKRWSREFLPPDPLGGLQSGYARQYSIDDAFKVFLGGCLVGELGYSIPETRTILADLIRWGQNAGLFVHSTLTDVYRHPVLRVVDDWRIRIARTPAVEGRPGGFRYTLCGKIEERRIERDGLAIKAVRLFEEEIRSASENDTTAPGAPLSFQTLRIQALLEHFIRRLGLQRSAFPLLAHYSA
jgi:hypothetical protein